MKPFKYIIAFFFISLLSQAKAQDTTDTKINIITNGIGLSFTPLSSKLLDSNFKGFKRRIGWSLGFNNMLILSKKHTIFLLTEVGYLNNGFINKSIANTYNLIDAQGNINFNNITRYNFIKKYNYAYLSVSTGKNIIKLSKKTALLGTIGFRLNYIYKSTQFSKRFLRNGIIDEFSFTYSGSDIEQNITTSVIASIGIIHKFSNKFSVIMAPKFAYDLNKIAVNTGSSNIEKIRFVSENIYLSVLYSF